MPELALGRVFLVFLRLGATAYGGPAMMAYLKSDLVGKRHWLSEQEFKEGMALCQVIPGATMVQICTYTGYRLRGIPGALAASLGFILPAFLTMTVLTAGFMGLIVVTAARTRNMVTAPDLVGSGVLPSLGEVRRPLAPLGSVYAGGQEWTARTADERSLDRGTQVRVVRQEGLTLIVEPMEGAPA